MQQYQDLKSNSFKIRHCTMFQPTQPSPGVLKKHHTTHLTGNRHIEKDTTCGIGGGTTLTSFKHTVNMNTPITVAWKAQQFPQFQRT
jgi:hypothetical protein